MELEIGVPKDNVEIEYKSVFENIRKTAKIDGFRAGKAPIQIIESKYQKQADREVSENLVRRAFLDAVTQKQLTPVNNPDFDFTGIQRTEDFSFKALFEIPPTIELGKYRDIPAEERACKITDEDVAFEITTFRERYAEITKKDEGGDVQLGDYVKIQVKRLDEPGKEVSDDEKQKEYSIIVGKSRDESALDKKILGMKLNEEREVEVKYPKNYSIADLSGQKVKYLVRVIELNSMKLPALDHDFAKKMECQTIDELETQTRENLEKFVSEKVRGEAKAHILKAIVENSTFDLPSSIIFKEMAAIFQRVQQRFGLNMESVDEFAGLMGIEPDDYRNKLREEAEQSIKTTLVLSEVAKKENLAVSEERMKDIIEKIARSNKKTPEEIEAIIRENGSRENIESELLLDSAMEFIYDNGKVKKLKAVSLDELLRKTAVEE